MVDEHRLSSIKTDISGLAISKTFLWESSFVILPFLWKNGIHFPRFPQDFLLWCQSWWQVLGWFTRRPPREGVPKRRKTEICLFSSRNWANLYIFWLTLENRNIVGHGYFVIYRTEYGKVLILQTLILLKQKCNSMSRNQWYFDT